MITVEDDEGDICDTIPDESCTSVPENFFLNAVNGLGTKLGDQLASVGLVLPWFLDTLGVSTTIIGMLTPVRRAGALLPQLIVSGQIRKLQKRKWFWVAGGTIFGLALILMIPAAMVLPATYAGITILILLAFGSFGRGFSSVAFKDVTGKTIPKGNRGTLMALRATLGGILALIAGFIIRNRFSEQATESIIPYLFLIGIGGALWILSTIPVASLREHPGATEGSRNFFQELKKGYQTLKEIPGFRKFVLNRAVLLSIELSLPFYALYARQATGGNFGALGSFVIAGSLSKIFSSPFWGRFAD
ncbi:MAG: MFS transporter, partial [Aliifodinibius sp.]|nr:MFS transporter [Candidatus Saccharibacteria bacterium]NIT58575.1 MFS transporter [Fodinibius sp.]NIV13420.1 MFS transporter [Fodinibius sp.]NIY27158.1 MFS transporter [Fodinibius sp.]